MAPKLEKQKSLKIAIADFQAFFYVVWAGIEPATQGFSVLCSTD